MSRSGSRAITVIDASHFRVRVVSNLVYSSDLPPVSSSHVVTITDYGRGCGSNYNKRANYPSKLMSLPGRTWLMPFGGSLAARTNSWCFDPAEMGKSATEGHEKAGEPGTLTTTIRRIAPGGESSPFNPRLPSPLFTFGERYGIDVFVLSFTLFPCINESLT